MIISDHGMMLEILGIFWFKNNQSADRFWFVKEIYCHKTVMTTLHSALNFTVFW